MGSTILTDQEPFIVHVYASPIRPLSIVRSRIAFSLATAGIVTLGLGAVAAGLISSNVAISYPDALIRSWIVLAPVSASWIMVGLLGGMASRRWGSWVSNSLALAVLGAIAVFLLLLPSSQSGAAQIANDPVARLLLGMSMPYHTVDGRYRDGPDQCGRARNHLVGRPGS